MLSFKNQDYELYKSLLITESNYEVILDKINESDSSKAISRKYGLAALKHIHGQAEQNFKDVLSTAKQHDINWVSAELIEVKNYPRNKKDIERSDIIISAKSGVINFSIILTNCHKSDRWHIMNKVELVKTK